MRLCTACSPTVIFAVERANIDVAIFVLTLLGLSLLRINRFCSATGYLLFLATAAVKFYPVALLLLIFREQRGWIFLSVAICAVLGALFLFFFGFGVKEAIHILPAGLPFSGQFGAINLCFGLEVLIFRPAAIFLPDCLHLLLGLGVDHPAAVFFISAGTRCLALAAAIAACLTAPRYAKAFRALDAEHAMLLVAGAAITVFCFFFGTKYSVPRDFSSSRITGQFRNVQSRTRTTFLAFAVVVCGNSDFAMGGVSANVLRCALQCRSPRAESGRPTARVLGVTGSAVVGGYRTALRRAGLLFEGPGGTTLEPPKSV